MSDIERPSVLDAAASAALGMIPVVGPAMAEGYRYARAMDEWRIQQMAGAARETVGDDDLMVRRLADDERLMDLLAAAVAGARSSSYEAKRIALGRVLAHAFTDDAAILEDAALISALGALEATHIRFLARLAADPPPPAPLAAAEVPEPYRSQLVAQGAIYLSPSGDTYDAILQRIGGVTDFGLRLLDWIHEAELSYPERQLK